MILTDTHTHLFAEEFSADRKEMVQRAINSGVNRLFLPNIDLLSIQPMLDLVWEFPENCFPMMGLHPCSVDTNVEGSLFQVQKWFKKRKFYAIGEIGLDYYWSTEFKEQQISAFRKQIQWGIQQNLPIVIHSRNSIDDCISIIREMKHRDLRGIFHCFSGNEKQAQEIMEQGFFLGIGGVLTYKNAGVDKAIRNIPLEWMVLETDSPYLAPVPFRGKRNESAYLTEIAKKLAEVMGVVAEEIAEITTENSRRIFGV